MSASGSASHLCGLMFMSAIEARLTPIYYKGGGPGAERYHRRSHRRLLRSRHRADAVYPGRHHPGYAHHQQKAVPTLPNVPTSAEAGVPKFDVTTWYGLYAPRNTPKPIVDALVDALQKALKDPPLVNRFAELSMAPVEKSAPHPRRSKALSRSEIVEVGLDHQD
jgi:tripartite-type tricarboxylate transporter receptor subunit TctC